MRTLHDVAHRSALIERVRALRPDSTRRWGKMSVDQMLWHVNDAIAAALARSRWRPASRRCPGRCSSS